MKSTVTDLKCQYFPICRGCSHWHIPYQDQKELKIQVLKDLFQLSGMIAPQIGFISCGENALRHRVDFTIQNGDTQQMGFYDEDRNLLDIKTCLQLSPELQSFFTEFQKFQIPIKKGSVRLRVGPSGLKGAWLDFSNLDIKKLLEEKTILTAILEKNIHVEIGQKGKKLSEVDGTLKLTDPEPRPWFQTYDHRLKAIPLLGLISDFTQPSWHSAKKMIEIVLSWIPNVSSVARAIEFGPGLGSFTLPLLAKGFSVSVYESNASAVEYLKMNADRNQLSKKLTIHLGDFQNKQIGSSENISFALVNPPRSGLKQFTQELIKTKAQKCIYISCFPESLVYDVKALISEGYVIKEVVIVDQFPQTSHFETCVLIEKTT